MEFNDEQVQAIYLKIGKEFQAQLSVRYEKIFQLTKEIKKNGLLIENVREVYRLSHNLAGSAKTFGIEDVAKKSHVLAKHVYAFIENDTTVIVESESIECFVLKLKASVNQLQSSMNEKNKVTIDG